MFDEKAFRMDRVVLHVFGGFQFSFQEKRILGYWHVVLLYAPSHEGSEFFQKHGNEDFQNGKFHIAYRRLPYGFERAVAESPKHFQKHSPRLRITFGAVDLGEYFHGRTIDGLDDSDVVFGSQYLSIPFLRRQNEGFVSSAFLVEHVPQKILESPLAYLAPLFGIARIPGGKKTVLPYGDRGVIHSELSSCIFKRTIPGKFPHSKHKRLSRRKVRRGRITIRPLPSMVSK